MTRRKSLQSLTTLDQKFNDLLALEQIKPEDIAVLSKSEMAAFSKILFDTINKLTGHERDQFILKLDPIASKGTKNQLWETNHNKITRAISNFMLQYGRMPTNSEIAIETELSRQTVHKHITEFRNDDFYLDHIEQFRFMAGKVLAMVYTFAHNGDIQAAKLYLNATGNLNQFKSTGGNTMIQNQNNYIQINGTILSQDNVKQLNPEQLKSIETILKTALHDPTE